jgi:hypothetical protein
MAEQLPALIDSLFSWETGGLNVEEKSTSLYEWAIKSLNDWAAGLDPEERRERLTASDGPWGEQTMTERDLFMRNSEIDLGVIGFDGNNLPGTWQVCAEDERQWIFVPLTPANHLLLANSDTRATMGLFARIPQLDLARQAFGLDIEDAIDPVAAASMGALCSLESEAEWAGLSSAGILLYLGCLGCLLGGGLLIGLPLEVYRKVRKTVSKTISALKRTRNHSLPTDF